MSDIKYIRFDKLIEMFPDKIDEIKEHYLLLLAELSVVEDMKTSTFKQTIDKINKIGGTIVIGYVGNLIDISFEIVASGTLLIEPKIIRGCKNVGHIEDIVVAKVVRGQGVSQTILNILKRIARENNCYKVILDCDENVKPVYIKNGFLDKGVQMAIYF